MIYELRIYSPEPGKMAPLLRRFRDHTLRLFEKHQIKSIGYWLNDVGGNSDELWYMLAFESHAQREQAWAAFGADPEWREVVRESEKDGPLVRRLRNQIMRPTNFSPLN